MYIHREGYLIILVSLIGLGILNFLLPMIQPLLALGSLILFGLIVQFFRNPNRKILESSNHLVYAPADGQVVVIEQVFEPEYFQEERIQLSIFMSPLNVHVNRAPIGGKILYAQYHPGKYLVAWHPKSSTENERTTVVIGDDRRAILLRQIAGAVARRIKYYVQKDQLISQGEEFGFIKFGSRVDVFLPLDAQIQVAIGQKVKGNRDILAKI